MRVIGMSFVALALLAAVGLAGPKDAQHIRPLPLQEPAALLDGTVIMATRNVWQSKDGNWTNTASWSAGAVPGNTHVAIFDDTSQVRPTLNLAPGGTGPVAIVVQDSFRGGIGGPGNYLTFAAGTLLRIDINGSGDYYLSTAANVFSLYYTVINMTGSGFVSLSGQSLGSVHVKAGTVTVAANSRFLIGTTVATWGELANLTIEASDGVTWPKHLVCHGGFFLNQDATDPTTATASGNRLLVTSGTFRQEGLLTTAMQVYGMGGRLEYAPKADPSGETISLLINNVFDVSQSQFEIPVTDLVIGPDGEILDSPMENLATVWTKDLRSLYP